MPQTGGARKRNLYSADQTLLRPVLSEGYLCTKYIMETGLWEGNVMAEKNNRAGDSNRITREYMDSILIEMRHIDGVLPNTEMELYGKKFATPVMTAALSHLDNVCEKGMVRQAEGAGMAGAVNWAGMGPLEELEEITATGVPTIKIIKPYKDNEEIFRRIRHAEECGCLAIGMDLDHSFNRNGGYDVVLGEEMRPKSLEELKGFVKATSLPFIVKGVLSRTDAEKCLEAGVQGIVVSHHHGIMDYAVPPLKILPAIADVIRGQIPIFVDCGLENGADVFKALALGATAVCIGRVTMGPLGEKGAAGVGEMINDVTRQLAGFMARTGCGNLNDISRDLLWLP